VTNSTQMTRKPGLRSLLLASFVIALVLFGSFLPVAGKRALHTEGRFHISLHFAVFSIVGFVVFRVARSRAARAAAIAGAVLFGFLIEEGEHLVFRGGLEWKDVLVDAIGVVVGTLLALLTARREPATNSS
jgi:glycopeptide antibiotics resistance protein